MIGVLSALMLAPSLALTSEVWKPIPSKLSFAEQEELRGADFETHFLDSALLKQQLAAVPGEWSRGTSIRLPVGRGKFATLKIREVNLQGPAVAHQTGIKTYRLDGDSPEVRGVLNYGPAGVQATVIMKEGAWTLRPSRTMGLNVVVGHSMTSGEVRAATCQVVDRGQVASSQLRVESTADHYKQYRFALSGTGELTNLYGSVASAESVLVYMANFASLIFEKEVGIRLRLDYVKS